MILSGCKISGYNYLGKPTLASLGSLIFHWDYRLSIELKPTGSLRSLGDQSVNGFNLSGLSKLYEDGIGTIGTTSGAKGQVKPPLKALHDGTPHFLFAVLRYDNPSNVGASGTFIVQTGLVSVGAGITFSISAAGNQVQHLFRDDSGANISSQLTGVNTMPEDSNFRLVTFTLYGPTGANNSRITIADQSYLATRELSFGTNDASMLSAFRFGVTDITRIKTIGAYNLSGKSPSQIDQFVAMFNQVLKQDTEYASLITI